MALNNSYERSLLASGCWEPLSTILSSETIERTEALGFGIKKFTTIPVGFVGVAQVGTILYTCDGSTNTAIGGGSSSIQYLTTSYSPTITLISATNVRIIATGNLIINPPVTGVDGDFVKLWVTSSGGNYTVSLNASIKVPSTSNFISPQTILNGTKARITIQYDSVRVVWELVTFVNGY